jgi:hypothetical protein
MRTVTPPPPLVLPLAPPTQKIPIPPCVLKRLHWESHGNCFEIPTAWIRLWLPSAGMS